MHFLVYLSSASNLFTDQELVDILTKSRINNSKLGITGLLLYNEGNIIQVLEGEKQAVQSLYNIISQDRRHSGLITMLKGESLERNFPEWSMGFKSVSSEDWIPFAGFFTLKKSELLKKVNSESVPIMIVIKSFLDVNVLS